MHGVFDRVTAKLRSMVTRGRVVSAALNSKRPLVQLTGLADEMKTQVELFMPMGMSVYPTGNEDLVLLQVGGSRSHVVALFADNPALRITDLKPGEFGHRDANVQQIVFRQDGIEITTPLKMTVTVKGDATMTVNGQATVITPLLTVKGDLTCTGTITGTTVQDNHASMATDRSNYNKHVHDNSSGPNPLQ